MTTIVRLSNLICGLLALLMMLQISSLCFSLWVGDQSLAIGGGEMRLAISPPDYTQRAVPVLSQFGYSQFWLSLPEQGFYLLLNFWLLRLFALYRQMIIFSPLNVLYFQYVGILLAVWALWKVLYTPVFVTMVGFIHQSKLVRYIEVQDSQLMLLIMGLIVWATGRVMAHGLKLQQEQDLVI